MKDLIWFLEPSFFSINSSLRGTTEYWGRREGVGKGCTSAKEMEAGPDYQLSPRSAYRLMKAKLSAVSPSTVYSTQVKSMGTSENSARASLTQALWHLKRAKMYFCRSTPPVSPQYLCGGWLPQPHKPIETLRHKGAAASLPLPLS